MGFFTEDFLHAVKHVKLVEATEKTTPAEHLASWASGGDIIQQVATHSISHNMRHGNTDLVVAHEDMRQKAIAHMQSLHDRTTLAEDKAHAAKAIDYLKKAKVNAKAFPMNQK